MDSLALAKVNISLSEISIDKGSPWAICQFWQNEQDRLHPKDPMENILLPG